MPDRLPNEKVEGYKLTKEQLAFQKVFGRINAVSTMMQKGIAVKQSQLQQMMQAAQEIEGKKKELLLHAPDQPTFDASDEGLMQVGGREQKAQVGAQQQQQMQPQMDQSQSPDQGGM